MRSQVVRVWFYFHWVDLRLTKSCVFAHSQNVCAWHCPYWVDPWWNILCRCLRRVYVLDAFLTELRLTESCVFACLQSVRAWCFLYWLITCWWTFVCSHVDRMYVLGISPIELISRLPNLTCFAPPGCTCLKCCFPSLTSGLPNLICVRSPCVLDIFLIVLISGWLTLVYLRISGCTCLIFHLMDWSHAHQISHPFALAGSKCLKYFLTLTSGWSSLVCLCVRSLYVVDTFLTGLIWILPSLVSLHIFTDSRYLMFHYWIDLMLTESRILSCSQQVCVWNISWGNVSLTSSWPRLTCLLIHARCAPEIFLDLLCWPSLRFQANPGRTCILLISYWPV